MYLLQKTLVVIENRISELLGQACSQCLHVSEQEIVIRSSVFGLLAIFVTAPPGNIYCSSRLKGFFAIICCSLVALTCCSVRLSD